VLRLLGASDGKTEQEIGGQTMTRTSLLPRAATSVALLTVPAAALASPVTDADLRGKKICWNVGANHVYHQDGSLESNIIGNGTWRLVGDTLTEKGTVGQGTYIFTIINEGGTFHMTQQNGNLEVWGKYCK
jgi:hypothetical protein